MPLTAAGGLPTPSIFLSHDTKGFLFILREDTHKNYMRCHTHAVKGTPGSVVPPTTFRNGLLLLPQTIIFRPLMKGFHVNYIHRFEPLFHLVWVSFKEPGKQQGKNKCSLSLIPSDFGHDPSGLSSWKYRARTLCQSWVSGKFESHSLEGWLSCLKTWAYPFRYLNVIQKDMFTRYLNNS